MEASHSLQNIVSQFKNGKDTSYIEKSVLPLFVPGTDLFEQFNSRVRQEFEGAFLASGADEEEKIARWNGISSIIQSGVRSGQNITSIEQQLLEFYKQFLRPERVEANQNARAERCYKMVQPHLVGDSFIDYGCGKGLLGEKIKNDLNKEVYLVDNIDFNKSQLPLIPSDREGRCSLPDLATDTSIVYLVLHHMDNPLNGLHEVSRLTKKRIILMEGYIEDRAQVYINQSIDWLFNRILLGVDMNVPLNFFSVSDWGVLLNEVGFQINYSEYVGADEKLAPEHHVLIVADRK